MTEIGKAVLYLSTINENGGDGRGSVVAIHYGNRKFFVTAAHVLAEKHKVDICLGGKGDGSIDKCIPIMSAAKFLALDRYIDLAAFTLPDKLTESLPIRWLSPKKGAAAKSAKVWMIGYPADVRASFPRRTYSVGTVIQYNRDRMRINGMVAGGESGGAIVDDSGNIYGIIQRGFLKSSTFLRRGGFHIGTIEIQGRSLQQFLKSL